MKFLICGLGSIGQKHYKNLLSLGENDIIVFRTGKGSSGFINTFINEFKPVIFTNLNKALSQKPDAVFITNPTSQHISVMYQVAQAGYHLFIEKPISSSFKGIDKLINEIKKHKLISYVAYNFRFHPLLNTLKDWLKETSKFGRVVSFHASLGERVTDWHPWEDYRSSYACRKNLGGGVVLTQSHEIDYLSWLFGPVDSLSAVGGQLSDLDIEVEDVAKVIFRFKSGVVGSLDLDYLKRPPRRTLEIITTAGRILWDYYEKKLKFISLDSRLKEIVVSEPAFFDRNNMYMDELQHFLKCVKNKKQTANSLEKGMEVLAAVLGVKKSIKLNGASVKL